MIENNFKCKECMYFTGVQCHGHGEFWGSCKLIDEFIQYFDFTHDKHHLSCLYNDIVFDDTECIIIKKIGFKISKYE